MKIAYFDCFAGVSGDMILGALLDAGLKLKELERALGRVPLRGYRIEARRVTRGGLAGTAHGRLSVSPVCPGVWRLLFHSADAVGSGPVPGGIRPRTEHLFLADLVPPFLGPCRAEVAPRTE